MYVIFLNSIVFRDFSVTLCIYHVQNSRAIDVSFFNFFVVIITLIYVRTHYLYFYGMVGDDLWF
jgi:hypothetical protein